MRYATAYRAFALFLRARYGEASVDTFTVAAVAAWRDELNAQGLAPSSVAQRVSAVRRLAAAIGADPLVAQVRCTQVQHERPNALSDLELSALLARPDLRESTRHRYAYLPFGAGPRACIGSHFAMLEATIALAVSSSPADSVAARRRPRTPPPLTPAGAPARPAAAWSAWRR